MIEDMVIGERTGVVSSRFSPAADGAMGSAHLTDDSSLEADIVIFSTGIRPRDRVAREAGLAIGERGGVVVGDSCQTSDDAIWAIGECASYDGVRSEEHTSELQSRGHLVCRLLLEKKKYS